MYTVHIEKECGCFKKSGLPREMEFDERQDAIQKARTLECRMNQEFCSKHYFDAIDEGDRIVIKSSLRPTDDEDDDLNIDELLAQNRVNVQFDDGSNDEFQSTCGSGNCGGES